MNDPTGLLGRVVGQAGTTAAWSLPGGGVGGALARGAAVAATQTASEVASSYCGRLNNPPYTAFPRM